MGLPLSPTTPHLYSPSLQLKLYQSFIFSIPILFSIILFLLFYLFYLKRRNSSNSLPLSRSSTQVASSNSLDLIGLKGIIKDKLPVIIFDADSRMKNTQCCVCLGEFELKEELHELPSCQHIFHKDCIHHWFHSSSTCPLCRCPVVIINPKTIHQQQPPDESTPTLVLLQDNNNNNNNININSNHHQQVQDHDDQQAEHVASVMMSAPSCIRDQHMVRAAEGTSRASTTSSCIPEQHMVSAAEGTSRASTISGCSEDSSCFTQPESIVVDIIDSQEP